MVLPATQMIAVVFLPEFARETEVVFFQQTKIPQQAILLKEKTIAIRVEE